MDYNLKLTETDRLILNSYKTMVEGLADYLGNGYELVLHSLESMEHSVIKIINGYHTGRKEGSPITDLALSMLEKIKNNEIQTEYYSYFCKNKQGEPLKSSTIVIRGENNRIIGLLCMNFYLNTPYIEIIDNIHQSHTPDYISETFVDNPDNLIKNAVDKARTLVENSANILPSLRNKEIITMLYHQGFFKFKDSVEKIAAELGLSRNTVYLHLRNISKEDKKDTDEAI